MCRLSVRAGSIDRKVGLEMLDLSGILDSTQSILLFSLGSGWSSYTFCCGGLRGAVPDEVRDGAR